MQVVIDIDVDVFTRLFDNGIEDYAIANDDLFAIAKAIRKGTSLPKGRELEQEPKTEWIPVYERLPKINQKVLVSLRDFDVDIAYNSCYRSDYIEYSEVLAWQPLPEPYQPLPMPYKEG